MDYVVVKENKRAWLFCAVMGLKVFPASRYHYFLLKIPRIPRPHPIVHLHYLEHFGASEKYDQEKIKKKS